MRVCAGSQNFPVIAADTLCPESGTQANSQERETIPGWCVLAQASSGRGASSLEKIFDYVGSVCSVFISDTPTGVVLNCHCPKTHEIEMNCAFLCSLTVKYFTFLQSYLCACESVGLTPTSLQLAILAAFCMFHHWLFFFSCGHIYIDRDYWCYDG